MCEDTTSEVFSAAFLDSYVCVLHLTVIINTATFLLCVWLILCKSTKEMCVYRWFLLNQWICCYLYDIFVGLLYAPLQLSAVRGACTLGILRYLRDIHVWNEDLSYIIWIVLMTATSVSILQALCYRYLAIHGNEDLILKTYSIILMVTIQFCYSLPHLLFKTFTLLSEEESIDFILNTDRRYLTFFECHMCSLGSLDRRAQVASWFLISFMIFLIFLLIGIIFGSLLRQKTKLSKKSYEMQMSFLYSLIANGAMPLIFTAMPLLVRNVLIPFLSIANSYVLLFLSFPLSSCHTTFSSLTLIIIIRPYRRVAVAKISALCHLFRFIKQKPDAVVLYNGSGIVNGEVERVSPKRGSVNAAPTRQSLVPTTEKMLDSPAQLSYCARHFTCWWSIIMGVLGVFGIISIVLTYLSQSSSSYYKSQP